MQFQIVVKFDHEEARVIAAARRSINIAYPLEGDPFTPKGEGFSPDAPERKALNFDAGDTISVERLERARTTLLRLSEVILAESDPAHWQDAVKEMEAKSAVVTKEGAVPLVGDPQIMVQALVEARRMQHREVEDALAVVDMALFGISRFTKVGV